MTKANDLQKSEICIEKYYQLIGKEIYAQGWHYDNGSTVGGKIVDITICPYRNSAPIIVHTDSTEWWADKTFYFRVDEMDKLLTVGRLPEANKFLNTGVNAIIK